MERVCKYTASKVNEKITTFKASIEDMMRRMITVLLYGGCQTRMKGTNEATGVTRGGEN